jgi:hypothetical protein
MPKPTHCRRYRLGDRTTAGTVDVSRKMFYRSLKAQVDTFSAFQFSAEFAKYGHPVARDDLHV